MRHVPVHIGCIPKNNILAVYYANTQIFDESDDTAKTTSILETAELKAPNMVPNFLHTTMTHLKSMWSYVWQGKPFPTCIVLFLMSHGLCLSHDAPVQEWGSNSRHKKKQGLLEPESHNDSVLPKRNRMWCCKSLSSRYKGNSWGRI